MSDVKAWTFLCLCALTSLMILAAAVANAQSYRVINPPPADCGLKRMNGKAWEVADPATLIGKDIAILKEFPATNTILFKIDEIWHAMAKKCLDIPAGTEVAVVATPTPAPEPELSTYKRTSKFWSLGYRKTKHNIDGAAIELPINQTWLGVMYGFQKHYPLSRKLEWKWGGNAELGVGSLKEDPSISTQFQYTVSMVTVFGLRGFAGISYRLGQKWILSFNPGLLLTYGPYPTPTTANLSMSSIGIEPFVGLSQDYYWSPKFSLRFEEGMLMGSSSLYFVGGIGLKVW